MAFTLFGRLKKGGGMEAAQGQATQKPPPDERIAFLVSQGLAEPEIIKTLKDEGYSFQEIDSGITNVLKNRVSDEAQQPAPMQEIIAPEDLAPIIRPEDDMQGSPQKIRAEVADQMDAVMEQMMEEKLSALAAEFDRIDARFDEADSKILKLASQINEIEGMEKKSTEKSETRIGELVSKDSVLEPRIAGLERAFKDIIPGLVESIRELKEMIATKKRESALPEIEKELDMDLGEELHKGKETNIFD